MTKFYASVFVGLTVPPTIDRNLMTPFYQPCGQLLRKSFKPSVIRRNSSRTNYRNAERSRVNAQSPMIFSLLPRAA